MSLNNVESTNGYLEATDTDGYAVSEVINQDGGEPDFTSVKNSIGKFEFVNISTATVADTLTTDELIQDGDNLVIVKDDNSIHEVVASGIIVNSLLEILYKDGDKNIPITGDYTVDNGTKTTYDWNHANGLSIVMTDYFSGEIPEHTIVFTMNDTIDLERYDTLTFKIHNFDGQTSSIPYIGVKINTFDETVASDRLTLSGTQSLYNGSIDLSEFSGEHHIEIYAYYASGQVNDIVLNYENYEMDTTSITAGEIPSKAYRVDEQVFYNDFEAVELSNVYSGDNPLLSDRTFDTAPVSGRTIKTKVQLSATGNKMTELTYDIYREL